MDYQIAIKETAEDLRKLEKVTKDLKGRDRARFLRLLKSGEAATQEQAGKLLGIKLRQSQRWWRSYQQEGLREFVRNRYQGRGGKLSGAEKRRLEERLTEDDVMSLQQGREYLAKEFGATYTIGGVSYLFAQMKIKLKTGRPSNAAHSAAAAETFKKNSGVG
jgi:transposase